MPTPPTAADLPPSDAAARAHAEMWARRYEAICEATTDFVGITDVEGNFFYLNPAARRMLGIGADEDVTALASADYFDLEHYQRISDAILESLIEFGTWTGELLLRSRTGRTIPVSQVTTVHLEPDGTPAFFSSISRDITATKELEATLEHQATHDRLTNLPNHALFQELVAHAIARTERTGLVTAVAFIDLDRFKSVNDAYGHVGGDEVLMEVAHRLRQCVRPGDTVGRFGGDEFTVLIEDLPAVQAAGRAEAVSERILAALREPVLVGSTAAHISASVGVAVTTGGVTAEELIRNADMALYRAKDGGKDRVDHFDDALRERIARDVHLASSLRAAVSDGGFEVEFQPVVSLADGEIIAAEALVRWRADDGRLLPPDEFIPIAEERGLINAIGEHVLTEAARHGAEWRRALPHFVTSVNASASQILTPGFPELVERVLTATGLPPDGLAIEVTEEVVLHDLSRAVGTLRTLRALGVWVGIDDFGTGYSSLAYLRDLPVTTMKIDREFVTGIVESARDRALFAAMVGMARALDLWVVVEGVEHEAQREVLLELGAHAAQGFLFSRPVPAADLQAAVDATVRARAART